MILRNKDKQHILAIASHTIKTPIEIWAYGSRVNGSAHETSDLNLVLRTKDLKALNSSEYNDFKLKLEQSTIPILIQVFDWADMPPSFQNNIVQGYEVLTNEASSLD